MTDFNPAIPQPNDNLSTSQGQILNNFAQLDTIFDLNHFTWDSALVADRGLHRKIDFPVTTTVTAPTGTAAVLYSQLISGVASPYFDNAVGSTCIWRGGSGNGLASLTGTSLTLPNGLMFSFGKATATGGTATVNFGFPNNLFSATLNGVGNAARFVQWTPTPTKASGNVKIMDSSGSLLTSDFFWMAIGN